MKRYALNIAIGLDQLANAVLAGHPDETLSSRAYRMRLKGHRYWGWTATAINLLFFWEADHCRAAHESEQRRTQLPRSFG
ncbi:MAG: hypothetical protein KA972_03505 [Brachymonas sp.]|nr:hypothetical protein [Brachymonas sp.]